MLSTPVLRVLILILTVWSLNACAPTATGVDYTGSREQSSTSVVLSDRAKADKVEVSESKVRAEEADTVVVNEVSFVYLLLLALGWLAPSPNEIARMIRSLFKRKNIK